MEKSEKSKCNKCGKEYINGKEICNVCAYKESEQPCHGCGKMTRRKTMLLFTPWCEECKVNRRPMEYDDNRRTWINKGEEEKE